MPLKYFANMFAISNFWVTFLYNYDTSVMRVGLRGLKLTFPFVHKDVEG